MEAELIGATIGTACFVVGIQIIFYTGKFENEYSNKIDAIKVIIQAKMEKRLEEFCLKKYPNINQPEGEVKKWVEIRKDGKNVIFKETEKNSGEPVNPFELSDLVDYSTQYNEWANFLMEGKARYRQIGIIVVVFGIAIIVPSLLFGILSPNQFLTIEQYNEFISNVFGFSFLFWFIISFFLVQVVWAQRIALKKIDNVYMKVKENLDI